MLINVKDNSENFWENLENQREIEEKVTFKVYHDKKNSRANPPVSFFFIKHKNSWSLYCSKFFGSLIKVDLEPALLSLRRLTCCHQLFLAHRACKVALTHNALGEWR